MPILPALTACLVIGISDGDTMTALCNDRQQVKIRLAEIDAPEKAQPFGQRSKQSLFELCYRKKQTSRSRLPTAINAMSLVSVATG